MRTTIDKSLTDNAWVRRTGYLRQIVEDQYDPALASPEEFVDWLTNEAEEEFDPSDMASLLNWATQLRDREL